MKKRILCVNEASPMFTGFSRYGAELLKRLHESGKYEIAEFGSYMSTNDHRASAIPWRFYGAMPDLIAGKTGKVELDPKQNAQFQKDYKENQFGKWKFDAVLMDFKPDIVFDIRDPWMVDYQRLSPLRSYFKKVQLACIDGDPLHPRWRPTYEDADVLLTYSQYGMDMLKRDYGLTAKSVAAAGFDTEILRSLDKAEARKALGLPSDRMFIGFLSRNQPRKLFPELILAFKELKKTFEKDKGHKLSKRAPALYLHTSIPDVGWEIQLEVLRQGLQKDVWFTYFCSECKQTSAFNWGGPQIKCPCCNKNTMKTPNTQASPELEVLPVIYSSFDLYAHVSTNEGAGFGIGEAKACGLPVLCMDFTATAEQGRQPGGILLKVAAQFTDNTGTGKSTMQRRGLFCEKDFVKKCYEVLYKWSEDTRARFGLEGRKFLEGSWEKCASIWMQTFDELDILDRAKTWNAPPSTYTVLDQKQVDEITKGKNAKEAFTDLFKTLTRNDPPKELLAHALSSPENLNQIIQSVNDKNAAINELEKLKEMGVTREWSVAQYVDPTDTFRILVGIPKTAGDVLLATAALPSLKKKFPHASIYFATEPMYKDILKGNPHINGVIDWHNDLYAYVNTEGAGSIRGLFDLSFMPTIVTQMAPHWLHNGYGTNLKDTYAAMCDVEAGDAFILAELYGDLPTNYITIQTGASVRGKNFAAMQTFVAYSKVPVVHVGSPTDPPLSAVIDLRGKTSFNQLAGVIKGAKLHIGIDSLCGHIAGVVGTKCITLFGATYSLLVPVPNGAYQKHRWTRKAPATLVTGANGSWSLAIDPRSRGKCSKPCHQATCNQSRNCIDTIFPYDDVIEALSFDPAIRSLFEVYT